jgi:hypothetical protein
MLARSRERQCAARDARLLAARAAKREDLMLPGPYGGFPIYGSTQLMRAVVSNDLPRVRELVDLGADLEACTIGEDPDTALCLACRGGHMEVVVVVRALLSGPAGDDDNFGAYIEYPESYGPSPLMTATMCGHLELVRFLLDEGASVAVWMDGCCGSQHCALDYAIECEGREEVTREIAYGTFATRLEILELLCSSPDFGIVLSHDAHLKTCPRPDYEMIPDPLLLRLHRRSGDFRKFNKAGSGVL